MIKMPYLKSGLLPHLHSIYPEITDYLEEKLEDPQWLSELNERLEFTLV